MVTMAIYLYPGVFGSELWGVFISNNCYTRRVMKSGDPMGENWYKKINLVLLLLGWKNPP